jgi:invasion protein IalB
MPIRSPFVVQLFALTVLLSVFGSSGFAQQRLGQISPARNAAERPGGAQKPPTAAVQPPANQQSQASQAPKLSLQPGVGWSSKCASETRQTPVECSVEQTVVVTNSGQLLASVVIRIPADTRQPVMMVQVPVGLYLPAGLNLQVDDEKPQPLALQTCDLKGCYAGAPVSPEMIKAMKDGKLFKITLQNMAKENISVPLTLANFAEAYQKIQ